MGDPLSIQGLQSFSDELKLIEEGMDKEAIGALWGAAKGLMSAGRAVPAFKALSSAGRAGAVGVKKQLKRPLSWAGEGIRESAERATMNPLKSLKKGWGELAPDASKLPSHMLAGGGNRVQEAAKSLGRGGWTGTGKMTKYMPNVMSQKALTVASPLFAAGEMADAVKKGPNRTGEGGVGEVGLGEAAGLAGMVAGGRKFLPSTLLYLAGRKMGRGVGRFVDRSRAGADPVTALSAPSPEEADRQLQSIGRHYT